MFSTMQVLYSASWKMFAGTSPSLMNFDRTWHLNAWRYKRQIYPHVI